MLKYKMSAYNDKVLGNKYEHKLVNFLNSDEGLTSKYKLYQNEYSTMDFSNDQYICELKTRRCAHYTYPSTMIGFNKLEEAINNQDNNKTYRFYFIFTDGTYFWDFKEGDYEIATGGRKDRGKEEYKLHAFIPVSSLTNLTTLVKSVS